MIPLLGGVLALVFFCWLGQNYTRADPKKLANLMRRGGGVLAMGVAAVLLVRGRFDMAVPLAGFGWWLFSGRSLSLPGWGGVGRGDTAPKPGRRSSVRSATVTMELDHDTGEMLGRITAGPLAGRDLASFAQGELIALRGEALGADPEGARLLEAYLDRRFPAWRENAEADVNARRGGDRGTRTLTEEEALQILGLAPGASDDDIRRAHRSLMKKLHPDQGGSTYLASRVNQAKDVLLNRHH
ncbi:DnaJ domain-containing protein [Chelatococcus sp. GCM10030263]|uniref:DnaJ domain-containing protein n=1 Tax=Chelatococcus sp. GCM10030263 TaxID=3273387 RepID=UPI003623E1FC